MAYVAMPEAAAEMMFQIIAGRARNEQSCVTTNLPFSEWTTMFPNTRLCKAMLDRLTDQAHIIETRKRIISVSKNAGEKRRQQIKLSSHPAYAAPKRVALRAPQGFAPTRGRVMNHQRWGQREDQGAKSS